MSQRGEEVWGSTLQYRKFIWIKVNIGLEGCQSVTDGRDNNEQEKKKKKKTWNWGPRSEETETLEE